MEFYAFMRDLLAWMASIVCLFPLTVPILYFAHRIREGTMAEDDVNRIDSDELWKRAGLGAFGVLLTTIAFLFIDVVLANWAQMPPGVIHFVVLLFYVPTAAFVLMYFFAYDDYFFGLGLFTLFVGLPMTVVYLINLVVPVWGWMVNFYLGFLKEIPK